MLLSPLQRYYYTKALIEVKNENLFITNKCTNNEYLFIAITVGIMRRVVAVF